MTEPCLFSPVQRGLVFRKKKGRAKQTKTQFIPSNNAGTQMPLHRARPCICTLALSCENHPEQAGGTRIQEMFFKKGKKHKEICLCSKYTVPHLLPRVPVQSCSKLHTVCVVNKQQLLYLCTFVY